VFKKRGGGWRGFGGMCPCQVQRKMMRGIVGGGERGGVVGVKDSLWGVKWGEPRWRIRGTSHGGKWERLVRMATLKT